MAATESSERALHLIGCFDEADMSKEEAFRCYAEEKDNIAELELSLKPMHRNLILLRNTEAVQELSKKFDAATATPAQATAPISARIKQVRAQNKR